MQKITQEYFEETLDSLFPDKESLEMNIITRVPYKDSKDTEVVITPSDSVHLEEKCYGRLETERYGLTVYMYHVDRVPDIEITDEEAMELINETETFG